jgi:hypothetical protein
VKYRRAIRAQAMLIYAKFIKQLFDCLCPKPGKEVLSPQFWFVALDTARSTSINPSFERFPSFKKMLTLAGFHGLSSYHPRRRPQQQPRPRRLPPAGDKSGAGTGQDIALREVPAY